MVPSSIIFNLGPDLWSEQEEDGLTSSIAIQESLYILWTPTSWRKKSALRSRICLEQTFPVSILCQAVKFVFMPKSKIECKAIGQEQSVKVCSGEEIWAVSQA